MLQDNRAQSVGLSRFILSLIAGAPVVWIVWEVTSKILPGAKDATNNAKANEATTWIQQYIDYLPMVLLLTAFMGILVLAIYQREVLR
jgi:hypothetical protein